MLSWFSRSSDPNLYVDEALLQKDLTGKRAHAARDVAARGAARAIVRLDVHLSGVHCLFALSPNSASCERVFSLVKTMFGEKQMSALADYIRAALMLKFNKRVIG